jgi:hypothetical protein
MGFYNFSLKFKCFPVTFKINKQTQVAHTDMHFSMYIPDRYSPEQKYNKVVDYVLDNGTPNQIKNIRELVTEF